MYLQIAEPTTFEEIQNSKDRLGHSIFYRPRNPPPPPPPPPFYGTQPLAQRLSENFFTGTEKILNFSDANFKAVLIKAKS